jgi:hypothetical protein
MRSRGSVGARRGRAGRALGSDGPLALLHVRAAVALVSRDGTRTLSTGRGVGKSARSLQLSKDGIFVCEQITHEAVAVSLVHAQTRFLARAKDAWRKCGRKSRDKGFVSRSQLDETSEVSANGVKGRNVRETQLAERRLQDRHPSLFSNIGGSGAVDSLDDFVHMRRNKGICPKLVKP